MHVPISWGWPSGGTWTGGAVTPLTRTLGRMSENTTDGELLPSASWLSTAGCFHPAGPADSLKGPGRWEGPHAQAARNSSRCPSPAPSAQTCPPPPPPIALAPRPKFLWVLLTSKFPASFKPPSNARKRWSHAASTQGAEWSVSFLRCIVLWGERSLSPRVSAVFTAPAAARSGALTMCRARRYLGPTPPFLLQPRVCTAAGERAGVSGRPGAH